MLLPVAAAGLNLLRPEGADSLRAVYEQAATSCCRRLSA